MFSLAETKPLFDDYGIIHEAMKILPTDKLKLSFMGALAKLEDNEAHKTRSFPRTRLHKVTGIKQAVYRADIDKISGWRLHVQYTNGEIHPKDIIEGQKHDAVIRIINAKKDRYE